MLKQTKLFPAKEPEKKSFFLPVAQSDAVFLTLKPNCEKLAVSLKTLEDFTTDLNYPSLRISSRIFELALEQNDPVTISLLVRLYTTYIKIHGSIVLEPVWKSKNGIFPFVKYIKRIWKKMDAAIEKDSLEDEYSLQMILDLLLYLITSDLNSKDVTTKSIFISYFEITQDSAWARMLKTLTDMFAARFLQTDETLMAAQWLSQLWKLARPLKLIEESKFVDLTYQMIQNLDWKLRLKFLHSLCPESQLPIAEKICLSGSNQVKGLSHLPPSVSKLFNLHFYTTFNSPTLFSKSKKRRRNSEDEHEDSVESISYQLQILLMYFDNIIAIDYSTSITSQEIDAALKAFSDRCAIVDPDHGNIVLWDALNRLKYSVDQL